MRKTRNAPRMIRYHFRATYGHLKAGCQRVALASRRSSHAIGFLIVALALNVAGLQGQGTIMPAPVFTGLDSSGNPISGGKLCTYVAGSSTPATTYTSSALSPGAVNTNPVILDGAGRATVFLRPGQSYKFALYTAGSDNTCNTGTLQWSQDNITAVPTSNVNLDVTGTAGESLSAGDLVYLSTGAGGGGANAGQWYKADADNTQLSTSVFQIGMAPSAIASGSSGTIRISGVVTVTGPLTPGAAYYASGTAGAITPTPPTNAIRIGQADSATTIILGFTKAPVSPLGPACGRLTLTTGVPITRTDVTAATTIYYTPAGSCNTIDLYNGTQWNRYAFAEISIAVPATTNTAYDVFVYDNAGAVALELTAWTSLTTRATAIVLQNGVWVKTGALTRRLVGSFRTTGVSGQTEDSVTKRYVSNAENQVPREFFKTDATATWNYSTATIRQANGAAANQIEVFISVIGQAVHVSLQAGAANSSGVSFAAGIGRDSTTTFARAGHASGASIANIFTELNEEPVVGHHVYSWNEWSAAVATTAWYGTSGDSTPAGTTNGLSGWTMQ